MRTPVFLQAAVDRSTDLTPLWWAVAAFVALFALLFTVLMLLAALCTGARARRAERILGRMFDLLHVMFSRGRCRCRSCAGAPR